MKTSFFFLIFFLLISCTKKNCEQCYIVENPGTNEESRIFDGKRCGDEIKAFEDKEYIGSDTPLIGECE